MSAFDSNYKDLIKPKYACILCDYSTSKKGNYNNHCESKKHKSRVCALNDLENNEKIDNNPIYQCKKCEKIFNDRSGLWRHNKKCAISNDLIVDGINIKDKDEFVIHLLRQNGELQKSLIEISNKTNMNNSYNNNNNINTTNNSFNLNLFLNETCKNAMNISDFVSSIKLNLEDLEHTGKKGYIEGISNIIVKNLNDLEQHMRPLHCSDSKREILYIKDNNEWGKETEDKPILTKAIKTIANENIKQISKWREQYPDCIESDSKKNNMYLKIVSNSMNGLTKEEGDKNIHKIISNVAKETIIQKK